MKSITLTGQQFTKRASTVKLPYIDLLSGFYLFGGNAASSLPNLAYGASPNLTTVAAPSYGTGYAVIDGTNGFETSLLMDTPFTQLAVVYMPGAASELAVFGRGAGHADNFVDMLVWKSVGGDVHGWPDGNQNAGIGVLPTTGFVLIGQSWGGTGTRNIAYAMTGNSLLDSTSSNSVPKTVTPTNTLKLGTGYTAGTSATRVAAAVLAPSILSVEQIYRMGLYLRALLATRGVTML